MPDVTKGPSSIIDPPTPYESPEVLWDFLRRLRDFDQEDPAVQAARAQVGRYLVVNVHDESES